MATSSSRHIGSAHEGAHFRRTSRSVTATDTWDLVMRALGVVAGAVAVVVALVAAARLDWGAGFDAEAVSVIGISFTPGVAIATAVAGLVAMAAGAAADRASKLLVGAVLACIGVAILVAGDTAEDLDLASGHGWLGVAVGAVLFLTGLAMQRRWLATEELFEDDA